MRTTAVGDLVPPSGQDGTDLLEQSRLKSGNLALGEGLLERLAGVPEGGESYPKG
jgi:hypothetical protein